MRISILALCTLSALASVHARAQDAVKPAAGSITAQVERGHGLLLANGCFECHGTVGQGSRVAGPRLAPQPIPFEAFLQVLRHPINDMPPYAAEVLSDADAHDIHAYLQSIPSPTRKVGDIPALNR
jgi:mono/diheme cytochrome c family protein